MNKKSSVPIITTAIVVSLTFSLSNLSRQTDAQSKDGSNIKPQCAQHCAHYCLQLLGVPVSMRQVCQLLPPKEEGESMLQIANFLEKAGLDCVGEKASLKDLLNGSFPVIAHLKMQTEANTKEQHFVVVERADSSSVKLLDGYGRRGELATESFLQEWDGHILRVMRPKDGIRKPRFLPRAPKLTPWLQFDKLFIDAGDIPQSEDDYLFTLPFSNRGTSDLIIKDIKTSCKCTVVNNPKKTIAPGETSKISVRYKFTENRGRFSQAIAVNSNDPYFPVIKLTLAGNGIQKVKTAPSVLSFGKLVAGKSAKTMCFVRYTGDSFFKMGLATTNNKHLQVRVKSVNPNLMQDLKPLAKGITMDECRNLYVVEGMIDTTGLEPGKKDFTVEIPTNLSEFPVMKLPVALTVVSPLMVIPNRLFLGEIIEGSSIKQKILIRSRVDLPIMVKSIDLANTGLQCNYPANTASTIELTFSGRITQRDQIENAKVTIHLKEIGSEKSFVVDLPISGLFRTGKS